MSSSRALVFSCAHHFQALATAVAKQANFALKGFFEVLLTSKGESNAFPPPSLPCNVVPMFELPIRNNKHLNFEWRKQGRGGGVWILLLSYVSTILSPIAGFNLT